MINFKEWSKRRKIITGLTLIYGVFLLNAIISVEPNDQINQDEPENNSDVVEVESVSESSEEK